MLTEEFWMVVDGIEASWDESTTYSPEEYVSSNPSIGQCAVSALLIQELCGGELMRGWAMYDDKRVRHYWNKIEGKQIDVTRKQFPSYVVITSPELCTRGLILENEWMEERLFNLKANYRQLIKQVV